MVALILRRSALRVKQFLCYWGSLVEDERADLAGDPVRW